MRRNRADYDSAWKEIIDWGLPWLLLLLFPLIHADIDWSRSYEILNTELKRIASRAQSGRGVVDRLIRVWLNDGTPACILLHIEIQSQVRTAFGLRMFLYNTGIYSELREEVISLAILADSSPDWRPDRHEYGRWGSRTSLTFPVAKLLDFRSRWEELEASPNPLAPAIMAHLMSLETSRQPTSRLDWKLRIIKGLYRQGRSEEEIRQLFRFIDAVMALPVSLDQRFFTELTVFEEEQRMPFITSVERIGMERGIKKGRHDGAVETAREAAIAILEERFGAVPADIGEAISAIEELPRLKALLRRTASIPSLEEFQREL